MCYSRYKRIKTKISCPEKITDGAKMRQLLKKHGELEDDSEQDDSNLEKKKS